MFWKQLAPRKGGIPHTPPNPLSKTVSIFSHTCMYPQDCTYKHSKRQKWFYYVVEKKKKRQAWTWKSGWSFTHCFFIVLTRLVLYEKGKNTPHTFKLQEIPLSLCLVSCFCQETYFLFGDWYYTRTVLTLTQVRTWYISPWNGWEELRNELYLNLSTLRLKLCDLEVNKQRKLLKICLVYHSHTKNAHSESEWERFFLKLISN